MISFLTNRLFSGFLSFDFLLTCFSVNALTYKVSVKNSEILFCYSNASCVFDTCIFCTSIGYLFQRGYGLQWRNCVIFFDTRRFPWAVDLKNVIISWLIKASLQFFLHFNYSNMSSTELQDFLTTAVEIAKQAGEVIHLHTFWLLFSFIWFNSWLSCLLDNGP